ncbi:MAG: hypothetical protein ACUVXI_09895 [bacterium]
MAVVRNVIKEVEGADIGKIKHLQSVDNVRVGAVVLDGEIKEQTFPDHDVFYLVYRGKITIFVKDEPVVLDQGEGFVVMKGNPHRISVNEKATVLVLSK